jgi:ribose/xylose/arabinose/galactoside ABC-type transport system permease subunit
VHQHPVADWHFGDELDVARLALALSNGTQVKGVPMQDPIIWYLGGGKILGVPLSVVLLGVVSMALAVVMPPPLGYRIREIGSNPDAATFLGILIKATRTWGFVLAALIAGLSEIVALAFFTVGDPQSGGGIELFAVPGAVIAGSPQAGGTARVFGAILGSVLLTAVAIGLVYFQIPATWAQFATGAVILGVVLVDGLVQRQRRLKGGP